MDIENISKISFYTRDEAISYNPLQNGTDSYNKAVFNQNDFLIDDLESDQYHAKIERYNIRYVNGYWRWVKN